MALVIHILPPNVYLVTVTHTYNFHTSSPYKVINNMYWLSYNNLQIHYYHDCGWIILASIYYSSAGKGIAPLPRVTLILSLISDLTAYYRSFLCGGGGCIQGDSSSLDNCIWQIRLSLVRKLEVLEYFNRGHVTSDDFLSVDARRMWLEHKVPLELARPLNVDERTVELKIDNLNQDTLSGLSCRLKPVPG